MGSCRLDTALTLWCGEEREKDVVCDLIHHTEQIYASENTFLNANEDVLSQE